MTGRTLDEFARQEHLRGLRGRSQEPPATLEDAVAHIDHAVKPAGVNHVRIGSNFDGVTSVPVGLEDVSKMPNLAAALLKRGYSEAGAEKIMGGSVLRVI